MSAGDLNETVISQIDDEMVGVEEINQTLDEVSAAEIAGSEDSEILSANYTPKDSGEIQGCVDNASSGDTIILDGYYLVDNTINVNKQLNFVGKNDATVDGNNAVRLFTLSGGGITFKDITFKNGKSSRDGGAIYCKNFGYTVVDCKFINNSAKIYGGAVYGGSAVNCSFVNNSAADNTMGCGGAVYSGSAVNCSFVGNSANAGGAIWNGSAVNCSFINNSAERYGGALNSGSATNCTFIDNNARYAGGAVHYGSAVGCKFINNQATFEGGAISYPFSVMNCSFVQNHAISGGAVFFYYNGGSVVNCSFVNNFASSGGAVSNYGLGTNPAKTIFVVNCSFINNSASQKAGAVDFTGNGSAVNCSFVCNSAGYYGGGAIYEGSAVNCTFINNTANDGSGYGGGAIYRGSALGCSFVGNSAGSYGGAIMKSTVSDCLFKNNNAKYGGAISESTSYNCSFINNQATFYGGAAHNAKIVGDCYFDNNSAPNGNDTYDSKFINSDTFTNLNLLINNNSSSDIYLLNNYTYVGDSNLSEGIIINRDLTIHGNGFTIDASNNARIFKIINGTVIFKDIIFTNGYAHDGGGAIYGESTVVNCSFVGNSVKHRGGGAMYGGSAVNCSFVRNFAKDVSESIYAGAMYGGSAVNCSFVGNSADWGGAMLGGSAVNCSFVGNSARSGGSAIYGGSAVNCTFNESSVKFLYGTSKVLDCIFEQYPNVEYHYTSCLKVDDLRINKGKTSFLVAYLYDVRGPLVNKTVIYNIEGNNYTVVTNSSGFARVKITDYISELGDYTVHVSHAGDSINYAVSKTVNVTVQLKFDPSINVNNLTLYVGEEGYLVVNLYYSDGKLSNKTVTFTINDADYNQTTDLNGTVKFKITDYLTAYGTYDIFISFEGDDYFNPASAIASVIINRYDSTLKVNNLSLFVDEEGYLIANLSDVRGPLVNKTVIFSQSNVDYNVSTDSEGLAKIKISDYLGAESVNMYIDPVTSEVKKLIPAGNYYISVYFQGDDSDNPSSKNVTVAVKKYDSVLNVDDLEIFKDEEISLIANLSDSRGPIVNKTVHFRVGDDIYNITTDFEGLASFEVNKYLSDGRFLVSVYFKDDECDNPSSKNVTLVIKKYDSVLNVDNLEIFKDESGVLVANLSDSRGPLVNKTVIFKSGNIKLGSVTTDLNGSASLDVNDYFDDEGSYVIAVIFEGDEYNKPVSTNVSVVLKKYDSFLTVNDLSLVLGEDGLLNASLSNSKGPIYGKTITFTVNGFDNSRTTSSLGLARFKISSSEIDLGKQSVTVSFAGDNLNRPVSVNATVIVSRYKGNLTVTQSGKYYGDTVLTFKVVNLKTNRSIPYVPIRVIFSNGRPVSLSTNEDGFAVYQLPFEPGNYTYTASVTSDNVDVNTLNVEDLEIHKLVGEIQLSHEDNSKTLFIRLVNPQNGDVYRNVNVHLEFGNGEVDDVVTNDLGMVVYDMPFTPGTYYVIASVVGEYSEFGIAELYDMVISDKDNSKVTFYDDIVFDYLKSGRTRISVENGVVLESGISVASHPEAVTHLEGDYIVVSNLSAGDYNLRVVTTPNEGYNSVVGTHPIKVNKIYPVVNFTKNIEFDYLDSDYTVVQITGGSIGNVSIDGNPEGAVINVTGNKITVSGLDAGSYTLRVTVSPDNDHKVSDGSENIYVRKINSEVTISDITFKYGQSGYGTVNVEGGTVNQSNIKIVGYDSVVPKLNGNIITVSGLNAGTYSLSVTSTPDKNHYQVTSYATVTVNKVKSSVELSGDITFNYLGSGSAFVVVNGGSVGKVSIDGSPKGAKITLKNNVVRVSGLNAGTYKLRVKSTPDKNHLASEGVKTIKVNKIASTISFSSKKIVFKYLKSGSTNVMVGGGKVLKSGLKIVGSKVKPSIKKNKITVSGLKVGTYTLKVTLTPDANHYAPKSSSTIKITVKKASAKIKVKKISTIYKKGKVWKIKLLNPKNKGIGKTALKLKIYTGKKFITKKIKTNSKGVAKFKVPSKLSLGKHKVVLTMSKNKYYAGKAVTSYITVKPIKLSIEVTSKYKYSGSTVSVWVKNKKTPVNNIKVKLWVYNGKKVKPFVLVTGNYKKYKGYVGYGSNSPVGKHNVIVKPVSKIYTGFGKTTLVIEKGANKYGSFYSLVSGGKLKTYKK